MKHLHKLEQQASSYRREMQRYRRQLESSGIPQEQVEERLEQTLDFYNELINNINKIKDDKEQE